MESETGRLLIQRLKQLRKKRGLTQEQFAEHAGLKYKHYQSVEAGRKPDIKISTVDKIAKALGLDPWELLHPDDPTPAVAELMQARYRRSPRHRTKTK